MSPLSVRSETDIHAPAQQVWDVLLDFAAYPAWNPSIRALRGEALLGASLRLRIPLLPGRRCLPVRATVTDVQPPFRLRWAGVLLSRRLFCGEHEFLLQSLGNGATRFIQRETFSGALLPLLAPWLRRKVGPLYGQTAAALKIRAETLPLSVL